jgi:predicted transcriptional regulator
MTVSQIAIKFNQTPELVKRILNNEIISDYIERMRDIRVFEQLSLMENLSSMALDCVEKLHNKVQNNELKPNELIKVMEFCGDRVQRLQLIKQTKQIHQSDKEGVRKEVLSELKKLSAEAGNIIEYKPKALPVEIVEEANNG